MYSRFRSGFLLAALTTAAACTSEADSVTRHPLVAATTAPDDTLMPVTPSAVTPPLDLPSGLNARDLRVCADPNNLPFSNDRGEGLENELAELVAAELGRKVSYTWWAQRRGFIRNTLRSGLCDVVVGVPYAAEMTLNTRPYYRSTYVFATRRDRDLRITSLDDPQLRTLQVGVHMIGDDYSNSPPAHALAARGIVENVRGYMIYGNYAEPSPPLRLTDAVVSGELDVAIVWGPFAGWARSRGAPLAIEPVTPQIDRPFLPMVFDISMGVRRSDDSLRAALDEVLRRRRADVTRLVERYGFPAPARTPTVVAAQ